MSVATESPYIQDVIKLQLKKPKSWHWQLSTSKSSPHISCPIIQLYDSKGQLVLEAKDNAKAERRSWHSSTLQPANTIRKDDANEPKMRHLERCRSDSIARIIGRIERNRVNTNKETITEIIENREFAPSSSLHRLKKSKSDVIKDDINNNRYYPLRSLPDKSQNRSFPRRERFRTDDAYLRKLKYNEESLKRAELDGYKKFLITHIPSTEKQENDETSSNIDKNRYKTRTSSAGTLVICEESFNKAHGRRRRQASIAENSEAPVDSGRSKDEQNNTAAATALCGINGTCDLRKSRENRYHSDVRNDINKRTRNRSKSRRTKTAPCSISYSQSDTILHKSNDKKCNYIGHQPSEFIKEPKWISSTKEKRAGKKHRRVGGSRSDETSTSSSNLEKHHQRKGIKARVVKEQPKDHHHQPPGGGGGDSELLQLVRKLSTDHVKMGANVSRHSSKGLSGRRSQSSGSICNGKGRHNSEGKMCGSLPTYLDDRNNGCNNNHDCEKPPLDEVQRIPPLGDGAPLHWKFSDNQTVLCDQGYGSERSPEEEYPPPLPDHESQCHHHLEPHACYPFITPESTFTVKLTKSSRGLGLSVTGGIDSGGSWPGLIRIKRLFPHQPASACGLLNVGDLIIEANGITLTGLTNYEALEVLRTAPNQVELKVCRPPPDVLSCVSPISEVPPPPPRRDPPSSLNLTPAIYSSPEDECYHGEFEVTLTKIQGSLGFTLRKEDDSALGHYVRALVREPALTDGRIRAGDKIIAVNDVEISSMSHEQAVQFLRQCGDVVKLKLYRDSAQTPVAALSPTETTPRTSFSKKTHLRQEAVDMLNDIAVRKLIPGDDLQQRRSLSPTTSPRRLRRHPCPSDASHVTTDISKYQINDEQFHEGLLQNCHPYDDDAFNSLFSIESDEGDKPSRPSSLELYNPNQTPVAARKPRFNFSLAHNAYELNNLDPEVLDAPNLTYNLGNEDVKSTDVEIGDSFPKEPASMPHIPIDNPGFSYKNPAYQSAHPQCGTDDEKNNPPPKQSSTPRAIDDNNMKKWRGVVIDDADGKCDPALPMQSESEILAIELNRGWNSRLGFSLQGAAGVTYVSAVHADSVAARDGRLKPGDRVIKVNDESVEQLSTTEIIELLRIVRGPVCIVVSRMKSKEDCPKSNAVN